MEVYLFPLFLAWFDIGKAESTLYSVVTRPVASEMIGCDQEQQTHLGEANLSFVQSN
jgi:hypothetical protein